MQIHRLLACLGLAAGWVAPTQAEERNLWPVKVTQIDANGQVTARAWAGPLLFAKSKPDGDHSAGFRPFYLQRTDATGLVTHATSLYPLFTYRADRESYTWSVFNLINRSGPAAGATNRSPRENHGRFDIWPLYFSRNTGDPSTSYRGLLPIAGSIKNFYGYERFAWILFPLYTEADKRGSHTILAPWPIVRVTSGAERGFAIWPLFGWRERPDEFQRRYYLWPLMWNNTIRPPADSPAGTPDTRQTGFLPFFSRETRPGYKDQNYGWPFFGTTDRTLPYRYSETRYFWPFFVQGRGDDRFINRWGPFYTHSVVKGVDKTWIGWPIWQRQHWEEPGIAQKKTAVLFRVYWSQQQRSLTNPAAAPATKTHLWPLFSSWNNGAGRRQYQVLSPFEVFFQQNDYMRDSWTPLFALYRYDQPAPGEYRGSLLWDAVTWERHASQRRSTFHLGPLLSVETHANEKRIALVNGLVGVRRSAGAWRIFWLDFPSKRASNSTATAR